MVEDAAAMAESGSEPFADDGGVEVTVPAAEKSESPKACSSGNWTLESGADDLVRAGLVGCERVTGGDRPLRARTLRRLAKVRRIEKPTKTMINTLISLLSLLLRTSSVHSLFSSSSQKVAGERELYVSMCAVCGALSRLKKGNFKVCVENFSRLG
ncbi:hypothetical protein CsSME_00029548 [Camellia sinensis var. sinensis]